MEIIRRRLVVLLVISLVAMLAVHVTPVAARVPQVPKMIQETCDQSMHPDFCVSVLFSDPRTREEDSLSKLTYFTVVITNEKAKQGMSFVSEVEKNTTDPLGKKLLNYCVDRYEVGPVGGTENAMEDFGEDVGDKTLVANDVSSCLGPLDECNMAFNRPPYPANKIRETNDLVAKYCFLALDLIYLFRAK
ncbi:hypothetical protein H6P81_017247 [Aristolochia fimbriata]|uniref:Pectinesterase inhibitor domain-containing protein n=1 Tax=Aristolochia fimbriata TaxID=158543 RepID=A0AAV7E1X7_ARIFI|nr:hypothetical protein H6P81_017247 [Aristolochia fimbriata]